MGKAHARADRPFLVRFWRITVTGSRRDDTGRRPAITKLSANYSFVFEIVSGLRCRTGVIGFCVFGDFGEHFPLVHQLAVLPHQSLMLVDHALSRGPILVETWGGHLRFQVLDRRFGGSNSALQVGQAGLVRFRVACALALICLFLLSLVAISRRDAGAITR